MTDHGLPHLQRRIVLFFQVHQPRRLKTFSTQHAGQPVSFFDDRLNEQIMKRVAHDCYEPANAMLLRLAAEHPEIKVCFSISGEALEQMEKYAPNALESFKDMVRTGTVEMVAQPNYHSLCGLMSPAELQEQIVLHMEKVRHYFDVSPTVVCNAELLYNDNIGSCVAHMGFTGIICEGGNKFIPSGQTPAVFNFPNDPLKILLRNDTLSEHIASGLGAGGAKVTVDDMLASIDSLAEDQSVVLIGLDYEALGEQFKKDSGIIDFVRDLLVSLSTEPRFILTTASDAISTVSQTDPLSVPDTISWSAKTKDVSPWLGNDMQREAFELLAAQEERIASIEDDNLVDTWRSLQTTDHFFYMSAHKLGDDSHRSYFSQYPSPYEAFINYIQILRDLISNLEGARQKHFENDHAKVIESERHHPKAPVWAMKKELQTRLASEPKP
jgi:alpha-amylase